MTMTRVNDPTRLQKVRNHYESDIRSLDERVDGLSRSDRAITRYRGVTFFAAVAVVMLGLNGNLSSTVTYVLAGGCYLGFLAVAAWHEKVIADRELFRLRRTLSRLQLSRMNRAWEKIKVEQPDVPDLHTAISADLDLFGHASLFDLIANTHTPMGAETLRDWMFNPADPATIFDRQQAVKYLAGQDQLRNALAMRGRMLASSQAGPKAFVEWAESEPWLRNRIWLFAIVVSLTALIATTLLMGLLGAISASSAFITCGVLLVFSVLVNAFFTGTVHDIFNKVDTRKNDIAHYLTLFDLVEDLPDECNWLRDLKTHMRTTKDEPRYLLRQLSRVIRRANLRRSPTLGIVHVGVQLITLLDFYTLWELEGWQKRNGHLARPWFEAIGRFEAIASLATLAHDNPHWTYPTVSSENDGIAAERIGHPLIREEASVRNDVTVGPTGRFLLVTGSNMSGKSTLLRSLGMNAILAQMGAPVCADNLQMPSLVVATSMRVQDSLEDGVSFFMAELKRLKEIVDQSRALAGKPDWQLLFILDEILQGTNSVERHIAVAKVVHRLVANGAIGAVSTHDLDLANSRELADLCETVHFKESIVNESAGERMRFDYRLRPGLATTTNALKLLQLVGLGDD